MLTKTTFRNAYLNSENSAHSSVFPTYPIHKRIHTLPRLVKFKI